MERYQVNFLRKNILQSLFQRFYEKQRGNNLNKAARPLQVGIHFQPGQPYSETLFCVSCALQYI